jgi:formylglycine-generating enzyme required for sulfatase activity
LPTEAQWEYACRAGTTGDYAGNLDEMGWYGSNSGNKPHPVGQKRANAWGLHDMHGNVWEWCLDWYGNYPGGSVTDPKGAGSGSVRVLRGGCWNYVAGNCRSANRGGNVPGFRNGSLGFRLVLAPQVSR